MDIDTLFPLCISPATLNFYFIAQHQFASPSVFRISHITLNIALSMLYATVYGVTIYGFVPCPLTEHVGYGQVQKFPFVKIVPVHIFSSN